ncbi:MAG: sulfurtransferase TusA family protein [Bacilli bacterium]
MSDKIIVDETLDCKGLSCPMPVVKTKKAIDALEPGKVLKVEATDKGSLADLKSWASRTGHQYLGHIEEEGVFKHYLRKSRPEEIKEDVKHPHIVRNEDLHERLGQGNVKVIDVREPAEYAFEHIPGSVSVPLGELEERMSEFNKEDEIYIICRTATRSDAACQILSGKGFKNVKNVVPGMSEWTGETSSLN